MANTNFLKSLGATAFGLVLALGAAGCGTSVPVGGLTNPNPGSVVDRDKASTRVDSPGSGDRSAGAEPIAEAASSSPAATGTTAGGGGPGGGQPGNDTAASRGAAGGASAVPASPPAKENAGSAAGATRPAGNIEVGTPRSPQ